MAFSGQVLLPSPRALSNPVKVGAVVYPYPNGSSAAATSSWSSSSVSSAAGSPGSSWGYGYTLGNRGASNVPWDYQETPTEFRVVNFNIIGSTATTGGASSAAYPMAFVDRDMEVDQIWIRDDLSGGMTGVFQIGFYPPNTQQNYSGGSPVSAAGSTGMTAITPVETLTAANHVLGTPYALGITGTRLVPAGSVLAVYVSTNVLTPTNVNPLMISVRLRTKRFRISGATDYSLGNGGDRQYFEPPQ